MNNRELAKRVGRRIRDVRTRTYIDGRQKTIMSQAYLSEVSGISASQISFFESGSRLPSLRNLIRIANAFDVTLDHLVGRDITYDE